VSDPPHCWCPHKEDCNFSWLTVYRIDFKYVGLLVGTPTKGKNLPQKHIAVWDVELDEISKPVKIGDDIGNLIAINEKHAWDLVGYPKIIDIETGQIVDKDETISSGMQKSSIVHHLEKLVQVSVNSLTKQLAIVNNDVIEILTL